MRALAFINTLALLVLAAGPGLCANETPVDSLSKVSGPDSASGEQTLIGNLFIREYRVQGATKLPGVEVEEAVYPFLGPGRTSVDVDHAREALEKAFHDKGYQTVSVTIPPQSPKSGVIVLQVEEAKVGKLLVKGARWFLPNSIARKAKSLQPGTVPNFNDVQRDIVALNKSGDLRVTPELLPGEEPGTVDINLNVEDKFPLHGSLELNNRYSENTVPLRLNGSMSYSNLWQLGHTAGFSFQLAPERMKDAAVYSGYYSVPIFEDTTFMITGTKQDSDVSTLGGAAVNGRGYIVGARATVTLPADEGFYHSLSFGMDYKHFDEDVTTGGKLTQTPVDYYPFSLAYAAGWIGKKSFTELNATMNMHFRGMGSDVQEFDNKRYNADGSYLYLRSDLTHTHDLPRGFQVLTKVQGQLSNYPLINSEQFAGGGQSSVRGYLESAALGDNGIVGTLELRSPSFIGKMDDKTKQWKNEWRVYAFLEGGRLTLRDALPEQTDRFDLASYGFGTRIKLNEHFNGSLDAALPMISQGSTQADDLFLSFRVWADF
jgi:hemolysin activation/secretion protein